MLVLLCCNAERVAAAAAAAQAANVLISADGKVYLADYGVVAPVEHVTGSSSNGGPERERVRRRHAAVVSTFTGTPAWMAPEVGDGTLPADGTAYAKGTR